MSSLPSRKERGASPRGPRRARQRRPLKKTRLMGVFSGMARVDAPPAPLKPQVTKVPPFGVLGMSGKKHTIGEFFIWGPPCAAHTGPAHGKRNPDIGTKERFPSVRLGLHGFNNEKKGTPTRVGVPDPDTLSFQRGEIIPTRCGC